MLIADGVTTPGDLAVSLAAGRADTVAVADYWVLAARQAAITASFAVLDAQQRDADEETFDSRADLATAEARHAQAQAQLAELVDTAAETTAVSTVSGDLSDAAYRHGWSVDSEYQDYLAPPPWDDFAERGRDDTAAVSPDEAGEAHDHLGRDPFPVGTGDPQPPTHDTIVSQVHQGATPERNDPPADPAPRSPAQSAPLADGSPHAEHPRQGTPGGPGAQDGPARGDTPGRAVTDAAPHPTAAPASRAPGAQARSGGAGARPAGQTRGAAGAVTDRPRVTAREADRIEQVMLRTLGSDFTTPERILRQPGTATALLQVYSSYLDAWEQVTAADPARGAAVAADRPRAMQHARHELETRLEHQLDAAQRDAPAYDAPVSDDVRHEWTAYTHSLCGQLEALENDIIRANRPDWQPGTWNPSIWATEQQYLAHQQRLAATDEAYRAETGRERPGAAVRRAAQTADRPSAPGGDTADTAPERPPAPPSTPHTVQGVTADTTHPIAAAAPSAPAGYVGLTRGRHRDTADVVALPDRTEPRPTAGCRGPRSDPDAVAEAVGAAHAAVSAASPPARPDDAVERAAPRRDDHERRRDSAAADGVGLGDA